VAVAERWHGAGRGPSLAFLRDIADRDHDVGIRWIDLKQGPPRVVDSRRMARLANGRQVAFVTASPDGGRTQHTLVPVIVKGRTNVGAIDIAVSLAGHEAYVRSTIVRLSLAGVAVLAVNLVLSVVLGNLWIGRPIRKVIAKARAVGGGDLSSCLEIRTKDEVGDLAREINNMAVQLMAQRAAVEAEHRERLTVQEQLRHSERLATVGKLAAGIAHEIGTPLNVADGYAKKILAGDDATGCARTICRQIKRITAMIRRLMRFARREEPRQAPVELAQLARDTVQLLEPLEARNGVTISVHGVPCTALADANQIQQVLTNLITNGVQAMAGSGSIKVRVDTERRTPPPGEKAGGAAKDYCRITVEDDGTGIAEANLPRIFDPFFTTKDVGAGTGLGLSVAHGIVRDHGGWIDVSSQAGRGSRFTVYLPRAAG
jgi:signal transduction histidine kinase